ncbi:MAG: PA2778 family cysteine peptidase [Rhodospirillales bacterium]|nr:MAG: PA2778 family cysteine peptidase [Rhodospirillales bacterium]
MIRWATAARFAAMGLVLGLAACAGTGQTTQLLRDPGPLPRRAMVDDVPFFAQERFYCGPAATAMALAWTGLPVTQDDLVPQVYTPGREGTLQPDVIAALRRNGRLAVQIESLPDLLAELAAGRPALVFQNLGLSWVPQWHFAIAIGYDLHARELILHSGTNENYRQDLGTFERTWERGGYWALAVLKAGQLPVRADEIAVLRAAAGLERVGQHEAAAGAYQAIGQRWPNSFAAHFGLGNTRYTLDDMEGAEAAFRRAIAAQPDAAGPAWNNLAYVLAALDRPEEAVYAARQAVASDPDEANYRATLAELEGRRTAP